MCVFLVCVCVFIGQWFYIDVFIEMCVNPVGVYGFVLPLLVVFFLLCGEKGGERAIWGEGREGGGGLENGREQICVLEGGKVERGGERPAEVG